MYHSGFNVLTLQYNTQLTYTMQVFPDEVHLDTLHTYLKACAELHSDVKVHVILVALVERLAAYGQRQQALGQPPIPPHIPLFDIFSDQIGNIAQVRKNQNHLKYRHLSLVDLIISLFIWLFRRVQKCHQRIWCPCKFLLLASPSVVIRNKSIWSIKFWNPH